jgi:hypothetical protein
MVPVIATKEAIQTPKPWIQSKKESPVQRISEEESHPKNSETDLSTPTIVSTRDDKSEGLMSQKSPITNTTFSFPTLVNKIKESSPALTTDLKTARFTLEGTTLTLIFSKNWNYERVNTPKVKNIITEICTSIFGGEWGVKCELQEGGNMNISEEIF